MPFIIDSMTVEGALAAGRVTTGFSTQATAASTLTLVVSSAPVQVFTGTVAGQVVQLPSGLTLVAGQLFEVINLSTQPVAVQDGAGSPVTLARISQSRAARFRLVDASTAGGVWAVSNDTYGANSQYLETLVLATNTSQVTWVAHTTLTPTNPLPLGNYIARVTLKMGCAANRIFQTRVTVGGVEVTVTNSELIVTDVDERHLVTTISSLPSLSGSPAIAAEFRVSSGAGGSTASCYESAIALLRES